MTELSTLKYYFSMGLPNNSIRIFYLKLVGVSLDEKYKTLLLNGYSISVTLISFQRKFYI